MERLHPINTKENDTINGTGGGGGSGGVRGSPHYTQVLLLLILRLLEEKTQFGVFISAVARCFFVTVIVPLRLPWRWRWRRRHIQYIHVRLLCVRVSERVNAVWVTHIQIVGRTRIFVVFGRVAGQPRYVYMCDFSHARLGFFFVLLLSIKHH